MFMSRKTEREAPPSMAAWVRGPFSLPRRLHCKGMFVAVVHKSVPPPEVWHEADVPSSRPGMVTTAPSAYSGISIVCGSFGLVIAMVAHSHNARPFTGKPSKSHLRGFDGLAPAASARKEHRNMRLIDAVLSEPFQHPPRDTPVTCKQ